MPSLSLCGAVVLVAAVALSSVAASGGVTGSLSISRRPDSLGNRMAASPMDSPLICDLMRNVSKIRFSAGRKALLRAKDDYLERAYDVGDCREVGHEGFIDALKEYFGDMEQLSELGDGYAQLAQRVSDGGDCSIDMVQQGEVFQVWKRLLFGVSVFAHLPRCSQDPSNLPLLKEAVKYPPPRLVLPQCEFVIEHCFDKWEKEEEEGGRDDIPEGGGGEVVNGDL